MHKPGSVMEECKRIRKQKQHPYSSFLETGRKRSRREGSTPLNAREALHRPPERLPLPPPNKRKIPLPEPEGSRRGTPEKGAATYSPALRRSTIGAGGLNFSVRDGKRWGTTAIATMNGDDKTPQARDERRPPAGKTGGREASGN